MHVEIEKRNVRTKKLFTKVITSGNVVGKSEHNKCEVQEHITTTYHIFKWRICVHHKMKFIKFS